MKIVKRSATDVVNTEYFEYSMYVLEQRAIPSAIDGFKNVHRKLVYSMLNEHKGKKVKLADLAGISKLNYHHGEASAAGAAVTLTSDWNNNAPIFTGHGNFGSRIIQEASAPRYIFASLSDNFKKFFVDTEVAPPAHDPENPEPAFYLPIIPWVLVNGISGIAVGFKTEILPRSVSDLVTAVKECIKNPSKYLKANKPIAPTFPSFNGTVTQLGPNQWKTTGKVDYVGKYTYKISELPIGYDRESYVEFLNSLLDKDLIKDYDDCCSKDGFGFEVKVTAQQKVQVDKDPIKYFKLERSHTEILTTLDHEGKLKIFDSVAQLVHYFVQYRTGKFGDKIAYDIQQNEAVANELSLKVKFIKLVINNKVDFRKSTKQQLLDFVTDNVSKEDFAKKFINIPLYECTNDEVAKLEAKIQVIKQTLEQLSKTTPVDLYKQHLNNL